MKKPVRKHLSEPWFTLVRLGAKDVEGRLCKGDFGALQPGDEIVFFNADVGGLKKARECRVRVTRTARYRSFEAMLKAEGVQRALPLPEVRSARAGAALYRAFYSAADEAAHGVVALELQLVAVGGGKRTHDWNSSQLQQPNKKPMLLSEQFVFKTSNATFTPVNHSNSCNVSAIAKGQSSLITEATDPYRNRDTLPVCSLRVCHDDSSNDFEMWIQQIVFTSRNVLKLEFTNNNWYNIDDIDISGVFASCTRLVYTCMSSDADSSATLTFDETPYNSNAKNKSQQQQTKQLTLTYNNEHNRFVSDDNITTVRVARMQLGDTYRKIRRTVLEVFTVANSSSKPDAHYWIAELTAFHPGSIVLSDLQKQSNLENREDYDDDIRLPTFEIGDKLELEFDGGSSKRNSSNSSRGVVTRATVRLISLAERLSSVVKL